MLSVIIPTLNASKTLPATFASLMTGLIDGMIKEVIISDGGSTDDTTQIAQEAGALVLINDTPGRGHQLAEGAQAAKSDWLLFLHADTELEPGWHEETRTFIDQQTNPKDGRPQAAAFTFALKDKGLMPSALTKMVWARCCLFKLPYGDQGLLIHKQTYDEVGGYPRISIMEDVALIRRLPTPAHMLKSRAFTCPSRYKQDGYINRSLRNLSCLARYYRGHPPEQIKEWYESPSK